MRETEGVQHSSADVVRRMAEAFNRRDTATLLTLLDDSVELRPFAAKLSGETYRGADGLRRWLAEVDDEWSEWEVLLDEHRMLEHAVLSTGRIHARGRETGVELELPAAFLSTVQGGHVVRLESFDDADEALAAASAG
jgi:ketosteroid isomerase-like protein